MKNIKELLENSAKLVEAFKQNNAEDFSPWAALQTILREMNEKISTLSKIQQILLEMQEKNIGDDDYYKLKTLLNELNKGTYEIKI